MEKKDKTEIIKEAISKELMRQIIIETDWNKINIVKADVAGSFEFKAIMQAILENIK